MAAPNGQATADDFTSKPLKVLELFAGIGGWALALKAALPSESALEVQAYDNAEHCTQIYEHNFGTPCSRRNIEQLGEQALDGFDIWVMSPPCQPFSTTREAKQRDLQDKRCKALEHLCNMLPRLPNPPRWITLENVKGFHGSDACGKLQAALRQAGFTFKDFLLDLATFSVPNHRTRYYLIAERSDRFDRSQAMDEVVLSLEPVIGDALPAGIMARGSWAQARRLELVAAQDQARKATGHEAKHEIFGAHRTTFLEKMSSMQWALPHVSSSNWMLLPLPKDTPDAFLLVFQDNVQAGDAFLAAAVADEHALPASELTWSKTNGGVEADGLEDGRCMSDFLEPSLSQAELQELVVSRDVLAKPFAKGLSFVDRSSRRSFCFTGHYGKVLHKSSGSMFYDPLQTGKCASGESGCETHQPLDRNDLQQHHGAIRFFSPKEILNLLGFPENYEYPPNMELKHRYKAAGNSIAVTVAAELLRVLLVNEAGSLSRLERHQRAAPCSKEEAASRRSEALDSSSSHLDT